jgi:hypothetical protein
MLDTADTYPARFVKAFARRAGKTPNTRNFNELARELASWKLVRIAPAHTIRNEFNGLHTFAYPVRGTALAGGRRG